MSEVLCRCPACTAKFKVDAKYAGKKARCPKCSVVVEVPAAGSQPISSSTTVVPSITTQAPPKAANMSSAAVGIPVPPTTASSGSIPKPAAVAKPLPPRPVAPPIAPLAPLPEPAMDAVVEEGLPTNMWDAPGSAAPSVQSTAPASSASASGFDFQLNTKSSSKSKLSATNSAPLVSTAVGDAGAPSGSTAATQPRGKKDQGSSLPLIIGAVAVMMLLSIGGAVVVYLSMSSGGKPVAKKDVKGGSSKKVAAATGMGKLVLDWSEDDRKGGFGIKVDGKQQPPLSKGELAIDLKPGERKLVLQRFGGYEPVETTVTIKVGEVTTFKPEWKKNVFNLGGPAVAATPSGSSTNSGGTDFSVGLGAGSPVKGFDGFTQNFQLAKENALKSQKNILIIFGRSDTDQQSVALGRAAQEQSLKDEIAASFIPVIIDFPQTRDAYDNVYDAPGNQALAKEFAVRQTPALALLDYKGKSYFLQTEWKRGTDLKAALAEGAKARTERDELWAAVKGESLEPAVKFVTWLMEKKLVFRYSDELKQMMAVAKRLDGANDNGHLECFIEASMMASAPDVKAGDRLDAQQFIAPMQDFLTNKKFKDDDRGARLHLLAATLLGRAEQTEEAMKHLARASTYNPKDSKLKDAVASAKSIVERGNILSTGTGFIVSEAGYIMTNHHVIEGRGKVIVRLPDNKTTVEGTVIAEDEERDIAIVKIEIPAGMTVKTVPVTPANVGRGVEVAAFGYPLAEGASTNITLTTGRVGKLPDDSTDNMMTLDLRVNPGNSGGPLCDQRGNVVGMVTAKTRTNTFTNEDSYGMAIPAPDLVKFLEKHLPAGTPRPPPNSAMEKLEWSDVDAQVSPGVLLILKME
jgi:S1-C subfamily serine protease